MSTPNVSADLVWEIVRSQNSYLVKRTKNAKVQFSRDPLNLTNVHSRKYAGFVNDKALGVVANKEGGVQVISKTKAANKPASGQVTSNQGANKSARKTYRSVATMVAKSGYRADLRAAAVSRASAIRRSQRPVKPDHEVKLRGKAAQKAAESS
ncbi:large subunit ribosomal protein L28e [Sporothrix brasiliensis 5110]|uniref:Large subunit ribosomal protein L28e n=1 Tax=Sporothrix brasiliensis 5110 TaxID=1398154 RepID=A0A0C2INT6_9PEZI|nr:large subunit ribosomal protein L28e [Sporothrix brasiliensis 5110]KIH90696.1 large subunit ribosomal protein L28e [Sporothrix brasiliensis 5110]